MDMSEYRSAFALFDLDGDGTVSSTELMTLLRSLGMELTPEEVAAMMGSVTKSELTFDDFVDLLENAKFERGCPRAFAKQLEEAFLLFDRDGSGLICASELKHVLHHLNITSSERDIEILMTEVTSTGLNLISFADFHRLMIK